MKNIKNMKNVKDMKDTKNTIYFDKKIRRNEFKKLLEEYKKGKILFNELEKGILLEFILEDVFKELLKEENVRKIICNNKIYFKELYKRKNKLTKREYNKIFKTILNNLKYKIYNSIKRDLTLLFELKNYNIREKEELELLQRIINKKLRFLFINKKCPNFDKCLYTKIQKLAKELGFILFDIEIRDILERFSKFYKNFKRNN